MYSVDPNLLRHLRSEFGDDAEAVASAARAHADGLAAQWGVSIDGHLEGATGSIVLTGVRADAEVVLRVPIVPDEASAFVALRAFAGRGGVEILVDDPMSGATLMPRLRPGNTLATVAEGEAVEALCDLILRLRGKNAPGPSVADYLAPTHAGRRLPDDLRDGLAEDVARLARRLVETSPPPSLMHGDLHHFNVLRHGDAWVAIDPEGIVGDPAYECAAFLRNPVPQLAAVLDLPRVLQSRIERFAERLGDPPARIWGWALVRTAQCVSWSDVSPFHAPWTVVLAALDSLAPTFAPSL